MPRWPQDVDDQVKRSFGTDTPADPNALEAQLAAMRQAETQRARTSILFLSLGCVVAGVGAGLLWGVGAGLVTAGLLIFIVGVLFGLAA